MSAMASQITGMSIVCSTTCSGADQRKHQSPASCWPRSAMSFGIVRPWWVYWNAYFCLHDGTTGDRWIPLKKCQWRGKYFHLMMSSWDIHQDTCGCIYHVYCKFLWGWNVGAIYPNICFLFKLAHFLHEMFVNPLQTAALLSMIIPR